MRLALLLMAAVSLQADPTATCLPSCISDAPVAGTPYGMSYSAKGQPLVWTVIGLDPGAYIVELTFIESVYQAAGQRPISVTINGVSFLSGFDVFATGGYLKPVVRSTVVVPVDGWIVVSIVATTTSSGAHAATLSGLAVRPVSQIQ